VSLYGTGRKEGVVAVLLIALLVLTIQVIGGLQTLGLAIDLPDTASEAIVPSIAGLSFYRFLRAQGRSRYTAFLTGVAYALSPWMLTVAMAPREQLAAALAPLALEAVSRCDRPSQRPAWLPWTGPIVALPFLAGVTLIGAFSSALCGCLMLRTATCGDRDERRPPARGIAGAALLATLTSVSFAVADPLAPWLTTPVPVTFTVLTAHQSAGQGLDVAAVLRIPGPCLLLFAVLGILRRQRHTSIAVWLVIAGFGALPTVLQALTPSADWASTAWHGKDQLAAIAWWLFLLGIAVLSAAGLDDFLDLPLRRRTALPWLLAFVVAAAPMIPTFGSNAPKLEWPLTATFLLLTVLLPLWRRMGILRFKNVLAVATIVALAVPALQVLPPIGVAIPPASPLGECTMPFGDTLPEDAPRWPYAGGALVLLLSGLWSLFAMWRSITARPVPTKAKAAITKKARPSQRP